MRNKHPSETHTFIRPGHSMQPVAAFSEYEKKETSKIRSFPVWCSEQDYLRLARLDVPYTSTRGVLNPELSTGYSFEGGIPYFFLKTNEK